MLAGIWRGVMSERTWGSKCCGEDVIVEGSFTHYYSCDKCGKPCDIGLIEKGKADGYCDDVTER